MSYDRQLVATHEPNRNKTDRKLHSRFITVLWLLTNAFLCSHIFLEGFNASSINLSGVSSSYMSRMNVAAIDYPLWVCHSFRLSIK